MPTARPLELRVAGLAAGYHGGTVLHDIDLDVPAGTVHVVVGANGAGKTTLIHTLAGIGPGQRGTGQILLGDGADTRDVSAWSPQRRARAGVALVPQGRRVFPDLTVEEHLRLLPHAADRVWSVDRLLAVFPQLGRRRTSKGRHLSGGEQQMLAIARALLCQPRLLLLDEPTEGLSPPIIDQVREAVLARLAAEGVSVLLATPDLGLARAVSDQVSVLSAGKLTARFDRASFPTDPTPLLTPSLPTSANPVAIPPAATGADLTPGAPR